jgi:hypothetical protein
MSSDGAPRAKEIGEPLATGGHDTEMPTDDLPSIRGTVSGLPASFPQPDPLDGLADCVRRLDPGTRALLDLSVRRRLRDDAMAPLLRTDPFHLAWRRARALERVASDLGGDRVVPLAQVRAALEQLPCEAWEPLSALPPAREAPALSAAPDPVGETPPRTTALVPSASAAIATPRQSLGRRLDAFATSAPTVRSALREVGRAFARKAVRLVVWS